MDAAPPLGCDLKRAARVASTALLVLFVLHGVSVRAAEYAMTVAGLGGLPEYDKEFTRLARELEIELKANGPNTHVVTVTGPAATRQGLQQALAQIAKQMSPDDTFSLYLIGHGTFDGETYKFNLPGPDVTAAEISAALNQLPTRKQLVVDMTSASGAAFPVLSAKGRVVITATKSGNEKNATVFARYWVEALRDPSADTDKNGTVSALEAYNYTQRKVKAHYDTEKLLASEHSLINTNGTQGAPPAQFAVLQKNSEAGAAAQGPLALRARDLEAEVEKLKQGKAAMRPDAYRQQLTSLLVELARTDLQSMTGQENQSRP